MSEAETGRAGPGGGNGLGRAVHGNHVSGRADNVGHEQRHVTGATAHIEHGLALANPTLLEQHPRGLREEGGLPFEARQFLRRMAEHVAHVLGAAHRDGPRVRSHVWNTRSLPNTRSAGEVFTRTKPACS